MPSKRVLAHIEEGQQREGRVQAMMEQNLLVAFPLEKASSPAAEKEKLLEVREYIGWPARKRQLFACNARHGWETALT